MDYVLGVGGFDLQRVVDDGAFSLDAEPAHAHSHSHGGEAHAHGAIEPCSECGEEHSHDHSHAHAHSHGHASAEEEAACTDPSHDHSHSHAHSHGHAEEPVALAHSDPVGSVSLQLTGELDLDAVNDWLGDLLQERWQDMYRMKGVLAIQGFPERYVVQGVHALFEGQVDRDWRDGETRGSKLVFIGKGLDEAELRAGFEACRAPQAAPA